MAVKTRKTTQYAAYRLVKFYEEGENNLGAPLQKMEEIAIFADEAHAQAFVDAAVADGDAPEAYEIREEWSENPTVAENYSLPFNPTYVPKPIEPAAE